MSEKIKPTDGAPSLLLKAFEALVVVALVYLVAAFSHWSIMWASETSFIENLTWSVMAVWLAVFRSILYNQHKD